MAHGSVNKKKGKRMTEIMIGIMWFGIGVYAGIHIAERTREGDGNGNIH